MLKSYGGLEVVDVSAEILGVAIELMLHQVGEAVRDRVELLMERDPAPALRVLCRPPARSIAAIREGLKRLQLLPELVHESMLRHLPAE